MSASHGGADIVLGRALMSIPFPARYLLVIHPLVRRHTKVSISIVQFVGEHHNEPKGEPLRAVMHQNSDWTVCIPNCEAKWDERLYKMQAEKDEFAKATWSRGLQPPADAAVSSSASVPRIAQRRAGEYGAPG